MAAFKTSTQMQVIKRNGEYESISFDKVTKRIKNLCWGLDPNWIDPANIAQLTIRGMHNNIKTVEIDALTADVCASRITVHPDYNKLAARICISNLHKTTKSLFTDVIQQMYDNKDVHGNNCPLISKEVYDITMENKKEINDKIVHDRDYNFSFFGIKTLERAYLIRLKGVIKSNELILSEQEKLLRNKYGIIIERPQHMWMRVSLGIHGNDLKSAFETYNYMSQMYFTHATPTLYNSGTPKSQFSSCFLMGMEDSIQGIYETLKNAALISKYSGGIGIHISDVRSNGSLIRGTNGSSDGIIPMIRVINATCCYVNQGGKRNGSAALYCEPWHADIYKFCDLRKKTGEVKMRARDVFLALFVPDLFMKRVLEGGKWSLMCPDECPGLTDSYGEEFENLYIEYENKKKYKKQVNATDLWYHILGAQLETGMPYMTYKDHINRKSNQKNIGVIKSSNLCAEITEYSDKNEIAVCNLASLCLPRCIEEKDGKLTYNFNNLQKMAEICTRNLNKIIDKNFYPVEETKVSNLTHRPIGLGVQGLADVYNRMHYKFDSPEAYDLNKRIFETIYYGALKASNELAIKDGPYKTFNGSPMSKGEFQFNLWGLNDNELLMGYDWKTLRKSIMTHGTRNSLLTALMPTASTSQIMNNNECFEPYTTNLYIRTTLAGQYIVINENLVKDLLKLGLWSENMRKEILYENGSIQNILEIPKNIRDVYLTAFETSQKAIIKQSCDRGPFIDQSQSLNIFIDKPNYDILTSCHIYGWKNGIKTGMYYLRGRAAADPTKFGLDVNDINKIKSKRQQIQDPRRISDIEENHKDNRTDNYEDCEMCGS